MDLTTDLNNVNRSKLEGIVCLCQTALRSLVDGCTLISDCHSVIITHILQKFSDEPQAATVGKN